MITLVVNGRERHAERDMPLIQYLREELRLTSVKNACGEGACGACTVLVDGKKVRACVKRLSACAGTSVLTVEGLSPRERAVYVHAFGEAGAVQCGFCIPGMVLSAKALLDENPEPDRAAVKKAIRGNICRCTGYQKIEDAILLAARYFREDLPVPQPRDEGGIGALVPRPDVEEKVLGTGLYADDLVLPGMVFARALRSPYPRARVLSIDVSRALAHKDAVRILTASDVPFNKTGHIIPDWDVMIPVGEITRTIGDAVALAASRKRESLDEILDLIDVEYQVLQPITDPRAAMAEDAPKLHPGGNILSRQELKRGDPDAAIAGAAHVVTRHYSTPMTDHAFMEPECAVAQPDGDGGVILYTGSQSVYDERREISRMLEIDPEKVRCVSMLVGGGFGGKEDMSVQHHAALMAWATGLPVKVCFSRQESLNVHTKRHAMEIDMTTACDANGKLLAMKALLMSDCGAYASLGGPVLQRACTHASGPYAFSDIHVTGICVYTNNVPGGAFRGFGVTQSCFAGEMNMNLLAREVGISPWEMRWRNAVRPGDVLPNGQIVGPDCAMAECLLAVREAFERSPYAGIAACMKNSGLGVGVRDIGRCDLKVREGMVHVKSSAACMGQGIASVASRILCTTTGLPPSRFIHERPDTGETPDSGTSTASRQTLFMGEAARRAAEKLSNALEEAGGDLERLEGMAFSGEYEGVTDPMGSDKPNPVSHIAYSYACQVVELDEDLRLVRVTAAHDVGRVIDPKSCQGQVEGGVAMGLGLALSEQFEMEGGQVLSRYGTLGLLRADQVPPIEVKLVEKGDPAGLAYGAKGVGEISAIPTAPAVALAAMRVDGVERRSLPISGSPYRRGRAGTVAGRASEPTMGAAKEKERT